MREDMAKVIVERPRFGSRRPSRKKGYRRFVASTSIDELPGREPMLGRWKGRERWLNEHLGPMRRFLRSRVGRPWNRVHAELCEHVSFDNAVQKHVLTHVVDYVELHVEIVDGEIVSKKAWRRGRPLPAGQMYVCPTTGMLKVVRRSRRRRMPRKILVDARRQYHLRDGDWWELTLRKIPDIPGTLWDVWLERDVATLTKGDCNAAYGGELFATAKRALSGAEVRRFLRARRGK